MRADADFMVYVGARWPSLVKEAVLLGVPPAEAADATADALSRCRRPWGRVSEEEDVDSLVRGELRAAAARRPRTPDHEREQAAAELLVLAPPSLDELSHRERSHSRTTRRRAAMVAVPLLLVAAGAGAYLATYDAAEEPAPKPSTELANAAVAREENPAPGVVWYADGQLHLDHAVLAVEGLTDMTRMGTGVVYGDDKGRVVLLADDGTRTLLGHKDPEQPVVASAGSGWAAWVETSDDPAIVIARTSTGTISGTRTGTRLGTGPGTTVGRWPVDAGARVVAIDEKTVYFVDSDGAHALLPDGPSVVPVTPATLLDVRSRTRAFQVDDGTIQVVQSYFDVSFELAGRGARLSPDGAIVATRVPGSHDGQVAVYDTSSGNELLNGLSDDDNALAFSPGDLGTITYVVAPNGLTPGRELQLRTCDLATKFCRIAARIPNMGSTPVLAS